MSARKRTQLFVDRKVQGMLIVRVTMYWLYCLLSISLLMVCWVAFTDRPATSGELFQKTFGQFGPALGASLVALPIVILDLLRLTNRFAGPMFRLRRSMRDFADGKPVHPVYLRNKDFWSDFAADFNRAMERWERERSTGTSGQARGGDNVAASDSMAAESVLA